jgi:sulfur relay (sulfurtransferase) complex TusBCD TusD component (DsrE family)
MMDATNAIVIIFKSIGMGETSEQPLKDKLTKTFLTLTKQNSNLPKAICFYTEGVRLACEGSPVLEELIALEAAGVHLILCQTCLDYFGLKDKVKVGIVGGMGDIMAAMWQADTVLTV